MATVEIGRATLVTILTEIADFLTSGPTLEQIANFHLSAASDRYISDLLEANRTRGLTPDERAALDAYGHIEHLMQSVKIQAFAKLDQQKRDIHS